MGTKVYLFSGDQYLRYDRADDRADEGYPLPVAGNWASLAEAGLGAPDAAVNVGDGRVLFFSGSQAGVFSVGDDRLTQGPMPISDLIGGTAGTAFADGVDAATRWWSGALFLFRGGEYVRVSTPGLTVDQGYPLVTGEQWPGMAAAGFADGIDSAIDWGDGTTVFFKGDQYLLYDMIDDRVRDGGYPQPIASWFPGVIEAGLPTVGAAVDLFDWNQELWCADVPQQVATKRGPKFLQLPWRGVLHTTEGGWDGALATFASTNFWPHFTIDPASGRMFQHLPLTIGARALGDRATPENAARCIQIEIVGFAAKTQDLAPEQIAFIREVMRRVDDLVPIPRRSGRPFVGDPNVANAPGHRMTVDEWNRYSGWCGHQHVPGETHWDPGAIDIDGLLAG